MWIRKLRKSFIVADLFPLERLAYVFTFLCIVSLQIGDPAWDCTTKRAPRLRPTRACRPWRTRHRRRYRCHPTLRWWAVPAPSTSRCTRRTWRASSTARRLHRRPVRPRRRPLKSAVAFPFPHLPPRVRHCQVKRFSCNPEYRTTSLSELEL